MLRHAGPLRAGALALAAATPFAAMLAPVPSRAIDEKPACVRALVALDADIDTARARAGDPFPLRVVHATTAADGTAIPENAPGFGIVAIANHAERGGRGGYVVIETRFVVLPSGAHIPVTIDWAGAARATATGASQNIPGIVGAIPFVGYALGPYAFIHHGKDVTLARGLELPVIVGDDEASGACRVIRASPGASASPASSPSPTVSP